METIAASDSTGDNSRRLRAPAKINLCLHVRPPREDGFHPLDSIVARVTLCDEIELTTREEDRLVLACPGLVDCPPERNLAYRAAELIRRETDSNDAGLNIRLTKRIPPGAGLGGGSSDAAAVLLGCNELWQLGLSPGELAGLGERLGSDVPLFLGPPASRITGRGERVQPVDLPDFHVVLVLPDLSCSTAEVYREFDRLGVTGTPQTDPADLIGPPSGWRDRLVNDLAEPACRVCPELGELREKLSAAVGLPIHVTGSGSGLFVLADGLIEAEAILQSVPEPLRNLCQIVRFGSE